MRYTTNTQDRDLLHKVLPLLSSGSSIGWRPYRPMIEWLLEEPFPPLASEESGCA